MENGASRVLECLGFVSHALLALSEQARSSHRTLAQHKCEGHGIIYQIWVARPMKLCEQRPTGPAGQFLPENTQIRTARLLAVLWPV
jgi:hypothetical protein